VKLTPEYRKAWYAAHPVYSVWSHIRQLCGVTKGRSEYVARIYAGVDLCREWRDSYSDFEEWAIGHGWKKGLQVARIDKNGDYAPENCVIVPWEENVNMRRNTARVNGVPFRKVYGQRTKGRGDRDFKRSLDRFYKCNWDLASALHDAVVSNKNSQSIAARIRKENPK